MRTIKVKPNCTPYVILTRAAIAHHAGMAKTPKRKVKSRLKSRYLFQPTQVRAWREYKRLSQEQLADMVGEYLAERGITDKGYTHASIGRMERGHIGYSQPIMEAISYAIGVPVRDLIATPPPNSSPPEEPPPEPEPSQEELASLWRAINAIRKKITA